LRRRRHAAYYLDAQAGEAFLPTVRQRGNLINLCKLISYWVRGPVAATTELILTLRAPLETALLLPAGTLCRAIIDREEIDFATEEALTIPPGELLGRVAARQGTPKVETLTASGIAGQRLELRGQSIAMGSLRLLADSEAWREVWHFQESEAGSLDFLPETDGLGRKTIILGDGRRGRLLPAGTSIRIEYLETPGSGGNLAPGLIRSVVTPIMVGGLPVRLTVTNPIAVTGGEDPETIDEARRQAPAELRSLWKAVTKKDYEALVVGFPGVAKVRVPDRNDCTNIRYYQVNIAVAPAGGGRPSPLLLQELNAFLETRKVITIEVRLFEPIYRPVDVDAEVFVMVGEELSTVRSRAEQAVRDFFSFERVGFGQVVYFSDLVALLDGIPGVSHVRLHHPAADRLLGQGEIPTLGVLQLDTRRAT
jgi:predicted phage baseplate assembly protein